MLLRRTRLLALLALAPAIVILSAGDRPEVCSLRVYGAFRPADITYFTATALPDTLLAAGSTAPYASPDPVFGQLVRITRAAGHRATELNAAGAADGQAVLVPWAYDSGCATIPWRESARWVTPGETGMFRAYMRDEAHWVDGIPTLDVRHAWHEPYPAGLSSAREPRVLDARLTPDEFFELYGLIPSTQDWSRPYEAIEPLRRWVEADPARAAKRPAPSILREAEYRAEVERVQRVESPVAGTYDMVVEIPGHEPARLALRMLTHPRGIAGSTEPYDPERPPLSSPAGWAAGYEFTAYAAPPGEPLPQAREVAVATPCHVGTVRVSAEPERREDGREVWTGDVDPLFIFRCFPDHPGIASAKHTFMRELREGGRILPTVGAFTMTRDGDATFEQRTVNLTTLLMRITGVRTSLRTVPGYH